MSSRSSGPPAHTCSTASVSNEPANTVSRAQSSGEQLDRVAVARGPGAPVRHRQRRDRAGVLARHRQRLPAGGEHGDDGRPEQDVGQHGARVDQVLAGIQDQQHPLVAQVLDDRVELGPGFGAGQSEAGRDGVRQQLGIVQPGQLDQARAIGELAGQLSRGAQRDTGLADAAGAGDRDQPGAAQQAAELGQLPLPSDEPGDLEGQLTGPLPG
jgi:hypothetical protein